MFQDEKSLDVFIENIKIKYRYINDRHKSEFINEFSSQLKNNTGKLIKDTILFRSQLGCNEIESRLTCELVPYPKERMIPTQEYSQHGRINPKGIPYLYLSDNIETAIAESRPLIGNTLTVSEFKILKDLNLVVFDKEYKNLLSFRKFSQATIDECIWNDLNHFFSKPASNNDQEIDYLPTQILSEIIKLNGFDGIGYKSSLYAGYNIALFDINNAAQPINAFLVNINAINYKFSECSPKLNYK